MPTGAWLEVQIGILGPLTKNKFSRWRGRFRWRIQWGGMKERRLTYSLLILLAVLFVASPVMPTPQGSNYG